VYNTTSETALQTLRYIAVPVFDGPGVLRSSCGLLWQCRALQLEPQLPAKHNKWPGFVAQIKGGNRGQQKSVSPRGGTVRAKYVSHTDQVSGALAREIAAVIAPGVQPPTCSGPDGIHITKDGAIHDPGPSAPELQDIRQLSDIQDNHWKLYSDMRRAFADNAEAKECFKGSYPRIEWHKGPLSIHCKTFDNIWNVTVNNACYNDDPWWLVVALGKTRDKVGCDKIETIDRVIKRLIAAIAPGVKVTKGL